MALILIVAVATVFAVVASATTSTAIELTAFNVTISATPLALFIAGALSVALLVLGFALLSRGTRRSARTHRELKQLRKENAIAATRAAAERGSVVAAEKSASDTDPSSRKDANTAQPGTSSDKAVGTSSTKVPGKNTDEAPGKSTGTVPDNSEVKDAPTASNESTEPPAASNEGTEPRA
ncbi:MAG TPA: hypothetical protein VF391_09430 [Dermatophilaceae bacterium]